MALVLDELDPTTRQHMLREFEAELAGNPYLPASLSEQGRAAWPDLMRRAILEGDDTTLRAALLTDPTLLRPRETAVRSGVAHERNVNFAQASQRLATGEFNTWYVRGLSARLLAEGVESVEVYRAAVPKWEPAACSSHEGAVVAVRDVYEGHRARYWPTENPDGFSVPFQPGCHHSIRRITA